MKEDEEKDGVVLVVRSWLGVVSHFRLVASFFVVDVRILPLRPGKARGVHRALYGNCRTKDMEVGGGRPILARSNVGFQYVIASKSFSPGFSVHVFSQELCLFLRTKQRIIQMQILICNPTNHVTQSLITCNVCRRFERIVLTIR